MKDCEACQGTGEGPDITIGGDGYGDRCCGLMDVPTVCFDCDGTGKEDEDEDTTQGET